MVTTRKRRRSWQMYEYATQVTDKPIKYVVLHYHAVRVQSERLSARAHHRQHDTYDLIVERGEVDRKSEIDASRAIRRGVDSDRWPTMCLRTSSRRGWASEVKILQLGRGHTRGDTVVWLPRTNPFSGDLVWHGAAPTLETPICATGRRRWTAARVAPRNRCPAAATRSSHPSRSRLASRHPGFHHADV